MWSDRWTFSKKENNLTQNGLMWSFNQILLCSRHVICLWVQCLRLQWRHHKHPQVEMFLLLWLFPAIKSCGIAPTLFIVPTNLQYRLWTDPFSTPSLTVSPPTTLGQSLDCATLPDTYRVKQNLTANLIFVWEHILYILYIYIYYIWEHLYPISCGRIWGERKSDIKPNFCVNKE